MTDNKTQTHYAVDLDGIRIGIRPSFRLALDLANSLADNKHPFGQGLSIKPIQLPMDSDEPDFSGACGTNDR